MRSLRLSVVLLLLASPLLAVDRWILISGTVGAFHTDARVLNPSFDRDIQIAATFFATDGTQSQGSLTVPRRQMRILNDVTTVLFNTEKLGAIRFTSNDEFEVTSRIFAITPTGTLGQFGPGLPPTAAKSKGALLQLRSTGSRFRTNIGAVNPNNAGANITWTLYDRNSRQVSSKTVALGAFGVIGPTNMAGGFFFEPGSSDISDAWVSFTSDQPVFVYASVVDNDTTDQTFIPAVDDAGVAPPPVTTKTFQVSLVDFSITFSPAPTGLKRGDQVILRIRSNDGTHGMQIFDPTFDLVVNTPFLTQGQEVERTFTITEEGNFSYFCNNAGCGSGHGAMNGSFTVRP